MKYIKIYNRFFNLENFSKIIVIPYNNNNKCSVAITYGDERVVREDFDVSSDDIQEIIDNALRNV